MDDIEGSSQPQLYQSGYASMKDLPETRRARGGRSDLLVPVPDAFCIRCGERLCVAMRIVLAWRLGTN